MKLIEETSSAVSVNTIRNISGGIPCEQVEDCDTFISDESRRLLQIIFFVGLSGPISVLGSAANVVNIVIFIRQGFNEPINISLCGLAISDLGSLLTLTWLSVCFNPLFQRSGIDFDPLEVEYITAGWPHGCFVSITSWITSFITFERCVCIVLPLKVKAIITPRRTFIVIIVKFVTIFAYVSPVFSAITIAPTFNSEQNRTLYGLIRSSNAENYESVSSSINVFTQLSCLLIVIVFTATLIINLRLRSQWRDEVTSRSHSSSSSSVSKRDNRVIKTVILISCIFITCYFPSSINIIIKVIFAHIYSSVGKYKNTFKVSWAIFNTVDAINCSISILVYYNMSSRFRNCFRKLFGIRRSSGNRD